MKHIVHFITSNQEKYNELKMALARLKDKVELVVIDIDLPEIQSLKMEEVAIAKAKEAYSRLQKPLLIDDTGFYFEQYPLFPGTLSKFVFQALGFEGMYKLAPVGSRGAFRSCLVYIDSPESYTVFQGTFSGTIAAASPRFDARRPYSSIFVPDGCDRPYIELSDEVRRTLVTHRQQAFEQFVAWLLSRGFMDTKTGQASMG